MIGRLFASFFGAVFIAGAFAYFNYKFSEFQFIDFSEWELSTANDIFVPTEDEYLMIIYNSKDSKSVEKLKLIESEREAILLDFYQKAPKLKFKKGETISLRTGTDKFLKIVQRFNVYELPTLFFIKRVKGSLYKQDSAIRTLHNFDFKE